VLPRAAIPSVDRVLRWPAVAALTEAHGRSATTEAVRDALDGLRRLLAAGRPADLGEAAVAARIAAQLAHAMRPSLRRVFNLTGTVLHTNLGRALLADEAVAAVRLAAAEPTNLEYDLDEGERGERDRHVERWLCRLTGAEAATVVNNNAAALLILLNTLALKKEVPVSRGELIEIGGSFRLPEIMARSGCKLREVGTTNRTHVRDYESTIDRRTGLILKVHTSNYTVEGFTAAVPEPELAALARRRGLPFAVDLGSGTLVDLERYGLPHEPTPAESLKHGADLVTFSGDKLLGGPQAGIIVGRADLVERIRRNPLKRALRVDKMTVAALEATLRLYAEPERLLERLPTLRLLTRPVGEIEAMAGRLVPVLARYFGEAALVDAAPCHSQIGSGALPADMLPSFAVRVWPPTRWRGSGAALARLIEDLRTRPIPVIGRVLRGAVWLDLRGLTDEAAFVAGFAPLRAIPEEGR
jgi:L-seryl-tRNA(Ser) seleniumtransferase